MIWKQSEDLVYNKCGKCCMDCEEMFNCIDVCISVSTECFIDFDCKDCKYGREEKINEIRTN